MAQTKPRKATVGKSAGAVASVSAAYFQSTPDAGLWSCLPRRGAALQDLMGGQIDLMFDQALECAAAGARRDVRPSR